MLHFDYQLDYTYSSSFGAVVTRDRLLIKRSVVRSFNLYVKVSVGKTWIHHGSGFSKSVNVRLKKLKVVKKSTCVCMRLVVTNHFESLN